MCKLPGCKKHVYRDHATGKVRALPRFSARDNLDHVCAQVLRCIESIYNAWRPASLKVER